MLLGHGRCLEIRRGGGVTILLSSGAIEPFQSFSTLEHVVLEWLKDSKVETKQMAT